MKKYLLGPLAITIAISTVAFTKAFAINNDVTLINYYFKFIGTRDSEESDVEKWEEVTATQYLNEPCGKPHFGCKLITTQVQIIGGETRPYVIYLHPGTNDPTTGTYVSTVSNYQN